MKIRKDMIFAVLTTFCMCALMFTVLPIRSGLPYDPWADYNDDNKIDIKDVSNVAIRFGLSNTDNLTRNVNVTNWPQDRPLTIKEGIEKIVVIDISQGLEFHETNMLYFYYDFEPKGSFINLTEVYYNIVSKGGNALGQHFIRLPDTSPIDYHTWIRPFVISDVIQSFRGTASDYAYSEPFNFSYIHAGINQLAFDNTQIGHGSLWVYSLELFIEYYYWG